MMKTSTAPLTPRLVSPVSSRKPPINRPLPERLINHIAFTLWDLLPIRPRSQIRTTPELLYFIKRITFQAKISCHIAVVALIYMDRCKDALPKNAIGHEDTCHRIIMAALLVASKFLHGTTWATCQQPANENQHCWLTNARMADISRIYSLEEMNQLERSFLNLIGHQCYVDPETVQLYLMQRRQDLSL